MKRPIICDGIRLETIDSVTTPFAKSLTLPLLSFAIASRITFVIGRYGAELATPASF